MNYPNKFAILLIMSIMLIHTRHDAQQYVQAEKLAFANPANIYGSDFLAVFQQYYKQANWNMMLRLTSRQSVNRYGQDSILAFYRQMDFGYQICLKSMKKTQEEYVMNYKAMIQATEVVVRCRVVVERDTCRIVLNRNQIGDLFF